MCSQPMATLLQGVSDFQTGKANAKLAKLQGAQEMAAAVSDSNQLHADGQRFLSREAAGTAASGVVGSFGSPAEAAAASGRNFELDRLTKVHQGQLALWARKNEATQAKTKGTFALGNSIIAASGQAAKAAMGVPG